jgi:hypothetical protein
MRYLARVHKTDTTSHAELQLLAAERTTDQWALSQETIPLAESHAQQFNDQQLVLTHLDVDLKITAIQDATDWVIGLVSQYLSGGISPNFLKQEADRLEQWRQALTLQNQELSRRVLEMEARREQIQEMENELQREKTRIDGDDRHPSEPEKPETEAS